MSAVSLPIHLATTPGTAVSARPLDEGARRACLWAALLSARQLLSNAVKFPERGGVALAALHVPLRPQAGSKT